MVPTTLWNDTRIQQALSQWRWSDVFQAIVEHTGASQTQLAVTVGLSQAQISRLASGTSQCFDIRTITQIVDGLGAPRRLAGLAPAAFPGTVEGERPEEADPMHRRCLLALSSTLPFAAVLGNAQSTVTMVQAAAVREILPHLYALDDQSGGVQIADLAIRCTNRADHLLNTADYSEATGRELQVGYGELAEMSGWLSFDAGYLDRAQTFYAQGLQAAHLADDLGLEVLVLASMVVLAQRRGRPREGIQLAQLAQRRAAGWAPARLLALLSAREATCQAQLGDAGAAQAAIQRAYRVFDPDAGADDPAWLGFFDSAELAVHRSTVAARLGHTERAASELRCAIGTLRKPLQRNRAMYTLLLGLHQLSLGDESGACATVLPALSLLTTVRSNRTRQRLGQFHARVRHSRNPAARQLVEQASSLHLVEAR